jgi:cell division protein FtsW
VVIKHKTDPYLLMIIISLILFGFLIFLSASLGLLAKEGFSYSSVAINQFIFGLVLGGIAAFIASKIPYRFWRSYSLPIFIFGILITSAVWIPGIGFESGGARRWLDLGAFSFQPGEFLKIAYLIFLASWLSIGGGKIKTFKYGTLPFLIISAIAAGLLMLQPDNDTAIVMLIAGAAMYFVSGANIKHIIVAGVGMMICIGLILSSHPYIVDRILTFLDPSADPLASGYQIQQSLIAIGSGGLFGRGFGQSIQKFNFLPEPIGDSIFAVAGEEFGFIGAVLLVFLFVALLYQSIRISIKSKDTFGGLLILGLAILISSQAFVNMASMLGIIPLSGLPLLFVSHGGSALLFTLFASGIMLNISKFRKV